MVRLKNKRYCELAVCNALEKWECIYRGRLLEIKLTSADETRALIVHDTLEDSADGLGGLSVQIDKTSVNAIIAKLPTINPHQPS